MSITPNSGPDPKSMIGLISEHSEAITDQTIKGIKLQEEITELKSILLIVMVYTSINTGLIAGLVTVNLIN